MRTMTAARFAELKAGRAPRGPREIEEFRRQLAAEVRREAAKRAVAAKRERYETWPTGKAKRDRKHRTGSVTLELELIHMPDKERRISMPQPAWNLVRITARGEGLNLVLREWNHCEELDGKTLKESNDANWEKALNQYEAIKGQLGGKE